MKIEISEDTRVMNLDEVVEAMENSGDIQLEQGEKVLSYSLECGCDLEVEIGTVVEEDPRCDAYETRTETYTIGDITNAFTNADYCTWAKDDDGEDVLVCFGAY